MDARAPENRSMSLKQLLEFEQYKLFELRRQQEIERTLPHGKPELLEPDVRSCEDMIRIWSTRLAAVGDHARA